MTDTIIRSVPIGIAGLAATPFRVLVPRQLDYADARKLYDALNDDPNIKVQDPFYLADVSSVFPGIRYGETFDLRPMAKIVDSLTADFLEDAWVEADVPEALEEQAAPLAVDDLTQPDLG